MQEFFTALFDLTFKKFITPQIVRFVYIIGIICSAVAGLATMSHGGMWIIFGPLWFITSIIILRCGLEVSLAIFQIARYSAEMARRTRPQSDSVDDPASF